MLVEAVGGYRQRFGRNGIYGVYRHGPHPAGDLVKDLRATRRA